MQNYNYTIVYKKGEDNAAADCLSRNFLILDDIRDMEVYKEWMTRNKGDFKKRDVRMFQKLQKMMLKMPKDDRIVDQEVAEATNDGMFILTKDGRLWKKDKKGRRLCIPREWGQYITHSRHNNNHFGVNRSYPLLK